MKNKVDINVYLKNRSIEKDENIKSLSDKYLGKAKENLTTAFILSNLAEDEKVKELLKVPKSYTPTNWIVIVSYYAMYSASTALLAKIGYKSNTHNSTIIALEHFFVDKNMLEKKHIDSLKKAMLTQEEIKELSDAKNNREKAQYQVTETIMKKIADNTFANAEEFVSKVEEILVGED